MNQQENIYHHLRVKTIKEEVRDFKTIVFEEGHNIRYKAGQYITLVRFENGEELRRSYSITSSPVLGEPLSIGVKRVENGAFSRRLIDRTQPGDELLSTGSGGFFVLPDDASRYGQLFFFAAGSGITPVLSLIKTALHAFAHIRVVLVYSNASVEKAVYLKDLQALQQHFGNRFSLETLFSNAADLSRARLHRDLLLSYLEQFAGEEGSNTLYYICGPESYMRLCIYTLQEAGVDSSHIRKENFYFSNQVRRDAFPPDTENHLAVIRLGNAEYSIPVDYPDAILKAAKKQGLVLPYSCEAGRCGNCVAKCVQGTIWHSYNEVLTEKELAQGLILTCVGHPVGGNVILEI
ncbi:MAG TPA: 2Fe-2S iron-sulfur cluster-binding protein [Flavisolibacter sp.]|jgi:ring-1,2-phenylacetyl-CoA epoxidase subunit PaaE|nr:2Fe-2S iron-sulfur cluster-binding protein [Flavisolibacter sp.]